MNLCPNVNRILLTALLVASSLAPAWAQTLQLPPVARATLPNGIRLVLMEYHRAPTLNVLALFPGGDSADPPGKAGTEDFVAELMKRGTEKRNAVQIADEIDFLGGDLETDSDDDKISVSLSLLSKDADAGLDLLTDVIRHSTFPAEELERERQQQISGLQALGEDPGGIADRLETETVFAGHPYGQDSTQTSLKVLTRDDVAKAYHRGISPNRMILVAVGDFQAAEMQKNLTARFGDWPKSAVSMPDIAPVKSSSPSRILADKPDATQTQVRWGRVAFPRSSPDYFPAELAEAILGGGFSSRLIDEIRVNRSLTYEIGSAFGPELHGGAFSVSSFTKIETTLPLLDETEKVLHNTAENGFTDDELKRMKGYLTGDFAIRMQTPDAITRQLASIAFYGLPDDYLQTYLSKLQAVPLSEANRIAKTYFKPDDLSLVLVAPASKVSESLKSRGAFKTLPAADVGK